MEISKHTDFIVSELSQKLEDLGQIKETEIRLTSEAPSRILKGNALF